MRQSYEFGPFRLDPARRVLLRGEKIVSLTPKAFETLALLVRNGGRVVEKDELMAAVWPDAFVEEGSLARNVSVLRKTLGESPSDHQYIETVPKRGYRFVADVREVREEYANVAARRRGEEDAVATASESVIAHGDGESARRDEAAATPTDDAGAAARLIESFAEDVRNDRRPNVGLPVNRSKPSKTTSALIAATLLIAAAVASIAYGVRRLASRDDLPAAIETMKVTRFTDTGISVDAAISPDGKFVVYAADDAGRQSLWVKQVAAQGGVQIVPPADVVYQGLAFSPDGNYVYYNMWDKKHVGVIYRVPALGGVPKKVIADVMPSVAVSPDGGRIAFVRCYKTKKETALMVAAADGTDERKLAAAEDAAHVGWFKHPAWSPDGKTIAYAAGAVGSQGANRMQIVGVSAEEGGPVSPITDRTWHAVGGVAWLKDGGGLVITAADQAQSPLQVWRLPHAGGAWQKVTNDVNGYAGLSLAADSASLVTVQADVFANVWVVPRGRTDRARKITSGRHEGFGLSWTPDGRIVYVSGTKGGNADIWITNADGGNKRQLTVDPGADVNPSVSSDGRYVVFASNRTGAFHLWRMDLDGGNQKQLTDGPGGEWWPQCSPADSWVFFVSTASGKESVWKVRIDGGESAQLTDAHSYMPTVSPDGARIAYSFWDETARPERWGREVISVEGGRGGTPFIVPPTAVGRHGATLLRWTPDGRALTYADSRDGVANLWSRTLDGAAPRHLTDFKEDQVFWFDWSRDGRQLACARGVATSDVVLIRDFGRE